jgi:hypothetical protein
MTSATNDASVPEACDMNLGPRERHRRLLGGHIGTALTVVAMVALRALHARRGFRLLLFLPIAFAAVGYLQYSARTCVHLAARGLRNLDAGAEKLTDFTVRLALRRRAEKIFLASLAAAALLTFVAYLV